MLPESDLKSESQALQSAASPFAFETPYRSAHEYRVAWAWEEASRYWRTAWKRRNQAHQQQMKNTQKKKWKAPLEEMGQAIHDSLPSILKGCRTLHKLERDMRENAIRNHHGLERGIQKWPVQNWTPLADLNTGLDWAFGVDRRLWQVVAYATQFYHAYAKKYRKRVGLDHVKGYKHVASGYLLKALGSAGVMKRGPLGQTLSSTSQKVEALLQEAPTAVTVPLPFKGKYDRRKIVETGGSITLHGVRHIAAASYLARLARLGFLDGSGPIHGERVHRYLVRARHIVNKRDHMTSRDYVLIGRAWLDVAAHCTYLRMRDSQPFFIRSPFYPPFFPDDERKVLAKALEDRAPIQIGRRDLRDRYGNTVTSLDWKH